MLSDTRFQISTLAFSVLLFIAVSWNAVQVWQDEPNNVITSLIKMPKASEQHDLTLENDHMFGVAPLIIDPNQLPTADLDLTIVGIVLAIPADQSRVMIRKANGHEKNYGLQQALPGGAVITKILPQSIVIKQDNHYARLTLPKHALTFDDAPSSLFGNQQS